MPVRQSAGVLNPDQLSKVAAVAELSREFVLDGDPRSGSDVLQAMTGGGALDGGLSWVNGGPASTWRRTWLDTFDWRLYRAGLTLEQVTARGRVELTLTGRDGEVLASERLPADGRVSWPSLLTALPPGPLRELLEPVAGIRALSPVARAASRVARAAGAQRRRQDHRQACRRPDVGDLPGAAAPRRRG